MFNKITLKKHFYKNCKSFSKDDKSIPAALFSAKAIKPDLEDFPYPLPVKKSDLTLYAETGDIKWFGGKNGLVRYDEKAEKRYNKVIYFSADRDLRDNNIQSLYAENDKLWVLTGTAVTLIEPGMIGGEEQANLLLEETLNYVIRRGMVSQKHLKVPYDFSTAYPYDNSDNDGGFTAGYALGEIFHYATLKREKGIDDPETQRIKAIATKSVEACLLLFYIHGRGNGFLSRTYCCSDEPIPDDGIFFIRKGDKAYIAETTASKYHGVAGFEMDCSAPIPERLRKLFTDEGYTEDGMVYKADTSSDETTLHSIMYYYAHILLGCDDKELDELIKVTYAKMVNFIIDGGFVLTDYHGKSTTWAKWCEEYFETEDGWVDGALNSAELLFYLKLAEFMCDDKQRFTDTYNYLVKERGYADMTTKHIDRLTQLCIATDSEDVENIMYGDHFLAVASFAGLCMLEKDEELLKKYRYGFKSWMPTIGREYTPMYTFFYLLACPDETTDESRIEEFFERFNISRLAASVTTVGRHDLPVRKRPDHYVDMPVLLPPDERFISKFDRDPFEYKNVDSGGKFVIESCKVYTLSYWLGRYYGFIEDEQ